MLNSANVRILLFIKSQGMLFDMPIQVGASVDKHGRVRQAHTRIQKVRAKELPIVREPIAEEIRTNTRLAAWLDKHGGIGSVAKIVAVAPDAAQIKMIDLMAGVGKLTPDQARKLLNSAIPNDSQADLFALAPKETDGTGDLFAHPATVKESLTVDLDQYLHHVDGKWKLKLPPPIDLREAIIAEMDRRNQKESHAQAIEAKQDKPQKASEAEITAFGVQPGITKQARRDLNAQAAAIVQRGGPFSDDDKAILRQYSGNGGCGDSLNEYYTRQDVATAMWAALQNMGVPGGSVLEPSCGPGVFLHAAPNGFKVTGVEMDGVSAQVAKALHGDRHEIQNASLERFAGQDDRQFDAIIGNVPFGLRGSLIKDDKPHLKTAEAYFCDTAMDKCKAAGIIGLIVPTGVMDGKNNRNLREMLLRKGKFLGAQRMPNTAFEHAHTEVTTDVIWLRKYPDDVSGALSSAPVGQAHLKALGVWDDEFLSGSYFTGRGAANIHGSMEAGWRAKAGMGADITVTGSMKDVADSLAMFKPEAAAQMPTVPDILDAVGADEKARAKVLGATMTRPYEKQGKTGDTKTVDGIAYVLQGRPLRWHRVDEVVQSEALMQGREIAARIEALMAGSAAVDRDQLQKDLQAWMAAHGVPAKNKDILLGAQQDKSLYRLIGAVNSQGALSDAVTGKVATKVVGNFEATVQSLLNDHETAAVRSIALSAGIHEEDALDQLYGSSKYAIDPATGEWTTQDIYLSGDLWAKSDAAKEALTSSDLSPEMRSKLEKQGAMLMDAIAPVSLEEAFIQVNSAFLPTSMLSSFLTWRNQEGPEANKWTKDLDQVKVTFADGVYTIEGGNQWGMQKDLDKYLNRTGLRKDDKHVIDDLNVEFKEWLCASPQYREQAEDFYNRKFRGFAEREFSNEPMDIPGMNTEGLKDYQWGTLRWALNAGKGIIASDVGLGKTVASLMLVKTLVATGQAKRPMIVVPKSVLSNWAAEAEKWFPGSKVLLIGAEGDKAPERKRKYHDMQQNHYDFIIVSEPSFEELDLDPATKGEYNARDFWVQRGDKLGNAGDKRTNKIKEAWNQARAGQEFSEKDRTDATYFNQMGVDAIVYDEAHHTKNLVGVKSRFGESPKYLGGGGLSMRSLDFNLKSRWLLDQNNGKNVFLCTATPTKNSPLEIFSMISHVAPELFERIGVRNSEEFLDRFAKFENGMALDTGGAMEEALITAGFQNMDELRTIMKRAIRRKTADDVGLKLPQRQDVQHMIQMDDVQQAKYAELRELAAESGGKDATGDSHIFSIMDKMNKAATDMSLLDAAYDATKSPKYVACAAEIVKNLKDGGQIVFSDYVDSHEKIAAALVASGIPRKQIGILNAKAASSSEKRQKIADDFNAGKLRVVIGNTAVMGEGLNLQKGTSDIHHLDLPWEPASMQQRNGRGLRQGNTNAGVRIHNYLARGSFDGYRLQAIMAKKDWQDAVWNGGNEVENLNKQDVNREELMIMLAADPDQAREAYESNHRAKEERLIAGKTAESAQRFVKFQEVKRSFNAIKDKSTQSAMRLKARMDKEYSALRADRYFTAKEALDMDQVIIHSSGTMLHSGAGIDMGDDGRYVVTGVDPRKGDVSMRRYGDETGHGKRVVAANDIQSIKAFAFNEATENEEIARKIAAKPLEIASLDDVYKLPAGAINTNRDKIQAQLWAGLRDYSIRSYGAIPLIEKSSGKVVAAEGYDVTSKSPKYSEAEYDILTPTIENKARLLEAWKDIERKAEFSTQYSQARRGKSTSTASRTYGTSITYQNPLSGIIKQVTGGSAQYYGNDDHPAIKAARKELHAEQLQRMRRATTFGDALQAAKPLGEIKDAQSGYSARVDLPKKALAILWAKARQQGILGEQIDKHLLGGRGGYFIKNGHNQIHQALLEMANNAGHDDLVHAIADAGIRHHKGADHAVALNVLAQGYGHSVDKVAAMQKLADAAGMMDRKRNQGFVAGSFAASQWNKEEGEQTVRDKLADMMQQAKQRSAAV